MAMTLVVEVYEISSRFPAEERFGLTAQCRRAAVSIVANIAEGNARSTRPEYRRFVSIARASVAELDTELTVAERIGFATAETLESPRDHADQIGRMLTILHRRLAE